MSTVYDLMATLGIDVGDFNAGLDDAEGKTSHFSSAISGLAAVGGGILAGGLAVASAATVALGKGLWESVQAASESELIQSQLNAVLRSTGGVAGVTADMVNNYADAMSKVTKFDDEEIVSAQSLLLTFTNIGEDIFPTATTAVLNMAQALGTDLKSSGIMVGKALQDPILGVTALRRVGVNFTESQQDLIKSLVESGDAEQAQALILQELQTEFGGSAVAAGKTFGGQLKILKTTIGNVFETIGNSLLPVLTDLGTTINDYIAKPETQAIIQGIADAIGNFATQVVNWLPGALTWIQNAFGWLGDNQGVIVAALAVVGVAIGAFLYMTASGAIAAAGGMAALWATLWPVLAAIAIIASVAYLVYEAWTNNWGGIRDTLMGWWAAVQPVIMTVVDWLKVNIPLAIQAVTSWWNNVLLPALQTFWAWVQANIFPLFQKLWGWFKNYLAFVIAYYAALWNQVLLPAIQAVWAWIQTNLVPLFQTLYNWFQNYLAFVIAYYSALWNQVLLPAIQAAWAWIQANLIPLLQALWGWFQNALAVALANFAALWNGVILPAIQAVWQFISGSLWPLLQAVGNFLGAVFGVIVRVLAAIWQNILLPALTAVWNFIQAYIWPLFQAIANFIGAVFNLVLTVMAGIWQNVVVPALQAVVTWFNDHLLPILQSVFSWIAEKLHPAFQGISDFWTNTVIPVIEKVGKWFDEKLSPALETVGGWIQKIITWFENLTTAINNIKLPSWLTPGSPTPFELGLRGIGSALHDLSGTEFPALAAKLDLLPEYPKGYLSGRQDVEIGAGEDRQMTNKFYAPVTFQADDTDTVKKLLQELR